MKRLHTPSPSRSMKLFPDGSRRIREKPSERVSGERRVRRRWRNSLRRESPCCSRVCAVGERSSRAPSRMPSTVVSRARPAGSSSSIDGRHIEAACERTSCRSRSARVRTLSCHSTPRSRTLAAGIRSRFEAPQEEHMNEETTSSPKLGTRTRSKRVTPCCLQLIQSDSISVRFCSMALASIGATGSLHAAEAVAIHNLIQPIELKTILSCIPYIKMVHYLSLS